MKLSKVLLGCTISWLSLSAAAFAQQTAAPDATVAKPATTEIPEIVITASKRAESSQKSTASVIATSGAEIRKRGKTTIDDVLRDEPNVQLSSSGGGNVFIRGIGSTSDTMDGRDMAIAVTIDGVDQASGRILDSGIFDVERVEVVAGPQGTLYGRNATGGVINLISAAPTHVFSARGSLQLGNYAETRVEGAVNLPLGDKFAVRIAAFQDKHDGTGSYGINALDNTGLRIRPLWDPTDRLHILGTFEYRHEGATPPQPYPLTAVTEKNPYKHGYTGVAGVRDNDYYNASLQIDYRLDWATLSVIPGYNKTHFYTQIPNPLFTEFPIPQFVTNPTSGINEQKTLEVHLASLPTSKTKWIVGVYGLDVQSDKTVEAPRLGLNTYCTDITCPIVITVPANPASSFPAKSSAIFGQITYPVLDKVRVTAGLRYTQDKKMGNYTDGDGNDAQYSLDFDNLSYTLGVEYDAGPNSLLYATIASGYKAGGANIPDQIYAANKAISKFDPEKLTAYTIGSKNTFLNRALQLNAEAYYYDYQNFQFSATSAVPTVLGASQNVDCSDVVVGPVSDPTSVCTNYSYIGGASQSEAYGAQVSLKYRFTPQDMFNAVVVYQQTKYGDFIYSVPGQGDTSFEGRSFINAPTWAATVGYEHTFELRSGATINARVDERLSSRYNSSFDYVAYAAFTQPGYHKTDLSIGFEPADQRWSLRAYLKNAENKAVVQSGSPLAVFLNEPRMFGLVLSGTY